jgi:hypothetical protein
VEHGERFERVYGMLLAIACMHAGLVAVRRRFEPGVLMRCLLYCVLGSHASAHNSI